MTMPRIMFGGDYNPEQWPEEVWSEDVALMKDAGVSLVTVGVFAWATVQPQPGTYDFRWLDRVLDRLAEAGVGASLATMTASPPPWLTRLHPEVLPQRADGSRLWPGARQHYCPSSPVYREHAGRLVDAVVDRYADHPALRLWHVNNEYGCHVDACYCDVSAEDFRRWLRDRYGDLTALNAAWSTAFWSQRYGDWADILPPRAAPTHINPAHRLDFARFSDDALLTCYLAERDIIRRGSPGVPITTNVLALAHRPVDIFRWAAEQDVISVDSYPDPADPRAHVDAALGYDLIRGARDGEPWILMEQAPSAVNWRERNAPKPPGLMRLWSWQAVAQGADAVMFFQWRQAAGGAEKFHSAMVPHGGPQTRQYEQVRALGRELAAAAELAGTQVRAAVALLHDWANWWAVEGDAHPAVLNLLDAHRAHYAPLFDAHVTCDVVPPTAELSGYRLVVVPNLYLLTAEAAARLRDYVRAGGHLVVSFFTGIVDATERVHLGGYPAPLRGLLGLRIDEFWPLPAGGTIPLDLDGVRYTGTEWSEWIELEGAEVVATFAAGEAAGSSAAGEAAGSSAAGEAAGSSAGGEAAGSGAAGELAGRPAITRHSYGSGVAWYLGTRPEPPLMREVLDRVRAEAGVGPVLPDLPDGVQAVRRHGEDGSYLLLLNHGDGPTTVRLPAPRIDLLADTRRPVDSVTLPRRGVAVLRA